MTLRRVVLNQSGSGYFERSGRVTGDRLALRLKTHEVDDVLATLTVLEQGPTPRQTVVAAGVPHATQGGRERPCRSTCGCPTRGRARPHGGVRGSDGEMVADVPGCAARPRRVSLLLQVWALVHNSSD